MPWLERMPRQIQSGGRCVPLGQHLGYTNAADFCRRRSEVAAALQNVRWCLTTIVSSPESIKSQHQLRFVSTRGSSMRFAVGDGAVRHGIPRSPHHRCGSRRSLHTRRSPHPTLDARSARAGRAGDHVGVVALRRGHGPGPGLTSRWASNATRLSQRRRDLLPQTALYHSGLLGAAYPHLWSAQRILRGSEP